jgi:hypothetical protein
MATKATDYSRKNRKAAGGAIRRAGKVATSAWLRGGAGPMADRRAPRGGARNEMADALEEYGWERRADERALTRARAGRGLEG